MSTANPEQDRRKVLTEYRKKLQEHREMEEKVKQCESVNIFVFERKNFQLHGRKNRGKKILIVKLASLDSF